MAWMGVLPPNLMRTRRVVVQQVERQLLPQLLRRLERRPSSNSSFSVRQNRSSFPFVRRRYGRV